MYIYMYVYIYICNEGLTGRKEGKKEVEEGSEKTIQWKEGQEKEERKESQRKEGGAAKGRKERREVKGRKDRRVGRMKESGGI